MVGRKLVLLILPLLLAGFGLVGYRALAADQSAPSSLGLTVSPPSFELNANPGDALDQPIRITNDSANQVTFETNVEDFRVDGREGSVTVKADTDPNAFSKWFSFSQTQVTLKSHETASVPVKIKVPKNAEPGGHFASVLFSPKSVAGQPGTTGAKVIQRVGSLFLMRVSGAVTEDGKIEKLSTKTFVGSWDEITSSDGHTKILVARDEKLPEERPKKWFDHGPVAFDLLFKNSGNVHFKPAGTLTIYNIFGQKVDTVALDPRNVFPGGERRVTVIWPQKSLWGFYYRAHVTALYGGQNKIISAETKFVGFPVAVFVAILVVLFLLILVRRRIGQAVRVLVKGR